MCILIDLFRVSCLIAPHPTWNKTNKQKTKTKTKTKNTLLQKIGKSLSCKHF